MRVIGIDVGFAITGWSIIEKDPMAKNHMKLIDFGAITTEAGQNIEHRLLQVFDALSQVLNLYNPDEMAVESLFFFKNQKTVINVAQVRGIILLAGELKKIPIYSYTPLQVKTAVTGYGRAEKSQVQKMVKLIFSLKVEPKPDDVADAIAVGVCHLNSNK